MPLLPPADPEVQKSVNTGCLVVVGIFAGLFLLILILSQIDKSGSSSGGTGAADYQDGYNVGFYVAQAEYDSGARKADGEAQDQAARLLSADKHFHDYGDGRNQWIRGYKSGYWNGWDAKQR